MWSRVAAILLSVSASCHAGLLGAGTGEGSCAAAPFRAVAVKWPLGCPEYSPCCTEYGYCRGADEWAAGGFRDCNGISNGLPLPESVFVAENQAAALGDTAGLSLLEVPANTAPAAVAAPRPAVITTAPSFPAAIAAVHSAAPVAVAAAPAAAVAAPTFGYASSAVNYAAIPQAAYAAAAPQATYAAATPLAAYGYGAAAAGHTLLPVTGSYVAAAGSLPAYAAHY